jgi:hypothetical protein
MVPHTLRVIRIVDKLTENYKIDGPQKIRIKNDMQYNANDDVYSNFVNYLHVLHCKSNDNEN